ncbi:serine/threonine-protein kinase [Streptomyces antibioticus]|uniref:serine/threonine-protein kinase n=1 Tax=Streptomyces antibioticus TaxID=1890 RepID=UPI003408251B
MAVFKDLEPEDPRQVGRYRIEARLGAGGMGRVYLARSPGGRAVAVKTVRPELAEDGDFRRRFAREVAAARRVNGAFTAGVVDADADGSPPWLATVYVPGVPLGEAIARHGPWPTRPVLALGAGLAEALEAIHAVGIVHRDLKPSNVLLAADGPRVIDFGISAAGEASVLTHTGMTIGTPGFMSPEQITGQPIGPASDVFSLGALLAHTATGIGPFGTGTPHALHYRAVHEPPHLDAVPLDLRAVVAACLIKQPGQRPTVTQLLDQLTATDRADEGGRIADAPLRLTEPGWMPASVAQLVRDRASTPTPHPLPRTPPEPCHQPFPGTADATAQPGSPPPYARPPLGLQGQPRPLPREPGPSASPAAAPTGMPWTPFPPSRPPGGTASIPSPAVRRPRIRWTPRKTALLGVGFTVLVGAFIGYRWTQTQYYVGAQGDHVAVYRGIAPDLAWLSKVEKDHPEIELKYLPLYRQKQVEVSIAEDDLQAAQSTVAELASQASACKKESERRKAESNAENDETGRGATPTPGPTLSEEEQRLVSRCGSQ